MDKPSTIQYIISLLLISGFVSFAPARSDNFVPVTAAMLENPDADDWLMLSRTYDEQRFSPLTQLNRENVGQLSMVWSRGIPPGIQQTIPIVYNGIMYVVTPPAAVEALDATSGDLIWRYARDTEGKANIGLVMSTSAKSLAIFQDLIYFTSPDAYLVALDARDGKVRWETKITPPYERRTGGKHVSAPIVVEGKVITGRACIDRENCFIAAHDALTGKEIWRFYTAAAKGEPGGDSWGDLADTKRTASVWGLPGSYDPVRKMLYWATANQRPHTRLARHGSADKVSPSAPSELYSNSTLALEASSGKLKWYYQHLPGDDWDSDFAHERILVRTAIKPDPAAVKWINPDIRPGEQRDIVLAVAEAGGIWALDRDTGQFLWASPFPADTPDFIVSDIDVKTGKTTINWDRVLKKAGDKSRICFYNTRSYWPTAYHPGNNSWYIPFHDYCVEMTKSANPDEEDERNGVIRPGVDLQKAHGLVKVDVSTGKVTRMFESGVPGNGAVLATAGDLIFWGDMSRRLRAFDADSGKLLWETILGGMVQTSTITYAVNGKQYVAVMTGDGNSATRNPIELSGIEQPPEGHNELYVFALPE